MKKTLILKNSNIKQVEINSDGYFYVRTKTGGSFDPGNMEKISFATKAVFK